MHLPPQPEILSDRTLFGNEFFTLFYQNGNFWASNRYFEKLKEYLKVRVLTSGRIYDLVIITPLLKGIDVDYGFRTYDLDYGEVQTFVISQLARVRGERCGAESSGSKGEGYDLQI